MLLLSGRHPGDLRRAAGRGARGTPSRRRGSSGALLRAKPSIGASSAFSASYWVPKSGYGKKSRSSRSAWPASWNCCEVNIPGSTSRPSSGRASLRRVLPDPAGGAFLVEGQDLLERVEDRLDLRVRPLLLAGHQPDVEVVAVEPEVEDVERAHRRPAVLVAEGERDQAVRLDLRGERLELVEGLRDLVALLRRKALAVEDRPRIG